MALIDCEAIANKYFSSVKSELSKIERRPSVHLLLATENGDSISYAKSMARKFSDIGIDAMLIGVESSADLEKRIDDVNNNSRITGGFVFYPTDFGNDHRFMKRLSPYKDIEGMSPENMDRLLHFEKT
ncbi:MAG TPA: tetrahydrofolate dehydrogenase/cyclohydrolase catalytic domain-containing protein, partial [Candidatus Nanoarchaeia archaeon]|nr:tetrahydrofolate dehydrogenase/cyclohydrolase catalytic domain-containing protein [Candidatus Nanoarchaeia archaeon]